MLPYLGWWNTKLKYSISAVYHSTWVTPNKSPPMVELPAKLATFSLAHHRTWKTTEKKKLWLFQHGQFLKNEKWSIVSKEMTDGIYHQW